jgi:hypothetical protein
MKITDKRLIIDLAKSIKKNKSIADKITKLQINVSYQKNDENTFVSFNDKEYKCSNDLDINNVILSAIKESSCDCVYYRPKTAENTFTIILYGKPINEFNKLSRLIYRYADIKIDRNDVLTEYILSDPFYTEYLCYNIKYCLEAINFIKENKKKNNLIIKFVEECDDSYSIRKKIMEMTIKNNKGGIKAEKRISL